MSVALVFVSASCVPTAPADLAASDETVWVALGPQDGGLRQVVRISIADELVGSADAPRTACLGPASGFVVFR